MLFLVISNPHPFRPSEARDSRINFRSWTEDLISKNKVICFYPRVGERVCSSIQCEFKR